jgi:MinD-like ATPase involved in chromosome partitioning or flagellar assembly
MSKRPVRVLSVVLLALAGAALIAGCDARRNTLEDGLSQPGAISDIRIAGGSGNVEIVGDSTTGVEVRRIARYRDVKPGQSMIVAGSTLNLDTNCGVDCSAS